VSGVEDKCPSCDGRGIGCLACEGTGMTLRGVVRKLRELEGRVAHLETELRWAGILPQK
jgi:hypothetical protein